ncbi:MAG: virulence RhuM family protein [Bacteroidetes bacterium]|nr:virulence RhuM family protein [Bacteroidota bacterium]
MENTKGEILLYKSQDDEIQIEVQLKDETVWLTQRQMAQLFQKDSDTIGVHIKNIYENGELQPLGTTEKNSVVQKEGKREVTRNVDFFNLDVIISVGFRVNSIRGIQFRIWAMQTIKEYLVKGFVLDDKALQGTKKKYFDELQERVRQIRISEKNFWEKVKDIFTTSIDYDPRAEVAILFYKQIQNMFHYAIHGHTAPELISERADASQANMGLTSFKGDHITRSDVFVAKNYLTQGELKRLNLLVDQYLSYAELQSVERKPMYMGDWINKTQQFFIFNEKPILQDYGHVSRATAELKANKEYEKYDKMRKEFYHTVRKLTPAQDVTDTEIREVKYMPTEKKNLNSFDQQLKGMLNVPPENKE